MELLVKKNSLVIPGDLIARGDKIFPGDGSYRVKTEDRTSEIFAAMIGLVKVSKNRVGVVPLEGCYILPWHPSIHSNCLHRDTQAYLAWPLPLVAL